jgi:hypothetical protein
MIGEGVMVAVVPFHDENEKGIRPVRELAIVK